MKADMKLSMTISEGKKLLFKFLRKLYVNWYLSVEKRLWPAINFFMRKWPAINFLMRKWPATPERLGRPALANQIAGKKSKSKAEIFYATIPKYASREHYFVMVTQKIFTLLSGDVISWSICASVLQ